MNRARTPGRSLRPLLVAALTMSVLPIVVACSTLSGTLTPASAPAASIDSASAAGAWSATAQAPLTTTSATVKPGAVAALPPLPTGWPSTKFEVGLTDSPGGAAALHARSAYMFRYQYLAGGVNTGNGWAKWNSPDGKFADYYVDESVAVGITPVFIYYQLLQSNPGGGDEGQADRSNLKNTATMSSYWADFTLLMNRLGAYSQKIVVDIEPDLWGYIQQAATGDNGATIQAAVASSGNADLAGLANNAAGFAQAFVRLRDKYAPNVMLGYELSMWGTLTDPIYQDIPLDQIDALAARSTAFQQSLGASFDLVFTDPADRDADFDRIINGDGGASWWDATDYQRFDRYVGAFVRGVGLRMVLWQIPLGNTKMPAVNNTWGHYKDNHVEWWFDDATGTHLTSTLDSGVVAMLFGGGADGTTSADGDGGYFYARTGAYYTAGAVPLPGLDWTVTGAAESVVLRGRSESLTATILANVTATVRVDVEIHGPDGGLVTSWSYPDIAFTPGASRDFSPTWATGSGNVPGLYTVQAGVYTGGGTQLSWNATAATFTVAIPGTYVSLPPTRWLDTRDGTGGLRGAFYAGSARGLSVGGTTVRGVQIPANALAVTGNLTVTSPSAGGYLYIGPVAMDKPTSSTLNFPARETRANAVTVLLGSEGGVAITYAAVGGATAQVIFDVTGYYTPDASGSTYMPLAPVRLLDSRDGTGGLSGPFKARKARTFAVRGRVGVPQNATAVTGNLTVTQQSSGGYLYIGPAPMDNPTSSTLNFPVKDNRANAVAVALAGDGTLSITYYAAVGATTHVVFDVTGYFVPDATGSVYVGLPPARLLDTRAGTGLTGVFSAGVARRFQVGGRGGVPAEATAVTGNLTVTQQTAGGYLFAGPSLVSDPKSSTLNFPVKDNRANAVAVALGDGGGLCITYAAPKGAGTHVVFDVTGYFMK